MAQRDMRITMVVSKRSDRGYFADEFRMIPRLRLCPASTSPMVDLPIGDLHQPKNAVSRPMAAGDGSRLRTSIRDRSGGTVHQAGKGCHEAGDGRECGGDDQKNLDHGLRSPKGARAAGELRLLRARRSAIMGAADPNAGSDSYQVYSGNSFSQEGIL